jgi:cytochrome c553
MRFRCTLLIIGVLSVAVLAGGSPAPKAASGKDAPPKASFKQHVLPFVQTYCYRCHGGSSRRPRGGLDLTKYQAEESLLKDRAVWEEVVRRIQTREMPPRGQKPSAREIEQVAGFLAGRLKQVDCDLKDPGRVTIRRLNRTEYNNTIRDLVGVDFKPAKDFPADDVGYGFDNIGDIMFLPPLLMEKYLAAAEKIVDTAFQTPALKKRIMITAPSGRNKTAVARTILEQFGRRAFRRPVTAGELDRLVRFVDLAEKNGDSFETGIQLALRAILVSPHFLFRIELDREPNNPKAIHAINEYELATRLSYFLWSSMPDEALFREAQKGTLRKNLEAQVERMLKDAKARALTENFASQWLQTCNLDTVTPNPRQFPSFNNALRADMRRETELFFEAIVKENRSILDFLAADFTFLNERLARHYGIKGVEGTHFRRVKLQGDQRGGVLTQASILTVTSNPTRTSPVKRGKWILENILGTPLAPPPPDVPELEEAKADGESGTLRQRMEKHRANPNCASCHERMDPLGFGFENYDAIGAWRTKEGNSAIDPSGTLPGGKTFKGPRELKVILKDRAPEFARCLAEKTLTYALGRGLEYYDRCTVDAVAAALAKKDYRFATLVIEVVKSDPFQKRRGKERKK